jgi:hypothetical protein
VCSECANAYTINADLKNIDMDTVLAESYTIVGSPEIPENIPGFLQTLKNVLTPEECTAIIAIAETQGFVPASIYTDVGGREHFSDTRKSSRCIVDSHEFVKRLWTRLAPFVPPTWKGATCVGLNERLRILRYDPGDEFKPHSDGAYTAPTGAISKITILIYLNEGYKGGYTHFLKEDGSWLAIEPHVGSVAMQDQALVHGVPPLESGRKYAIRTEVMYMPQYTVGTVKEFTVIL